MTLQAFLVTHVLSAASTVFQKAVCNPRLILFSYCKGCLRFSLTHTHTHTHTLVMGRRWQLRSTTAWKKTVSSSLVPQTNGNIYPPSSAPRITLRMPRVGVGVFIYSTPPQTTILAKTKTSFSFRGCAWTGARDIPGKPPLFGLSVGGGAG